MPVVYARHECPACGAVQTIVAAGACTRCRRCAACCSCAVADIPHRNHRDGAAFTFHGEPSGLFPRYVGNEIECGLTIRKGSPIQRVVDAWDGEAVSDGSITVPGAAAREIGTAPARGAEYERQIRDTCAALVRQGAKVDRSCGLHVHVDARTSRDEFTPTTVVDLVRLARLVDKIEAGLFNMVAPSRRKNRRYCPPWGATFNRAGVFLADSDVDKARTLDCAVYGSVEAARQAKSAGKMHGSRYRSVNFHSFHVKGTIEFRLHHGTVDPDKIINWSAICVAIVDYALTHSDEEIAALRGTPSEILDRIVTSPTVRAWMQKRREHFALKRSRTGEPPRRRAAGAMAVPLPDVVAGIEPEASEV